MKAFHMITFILLVIGGLNWLLVAFGWNLVSLIFGAGTAWADFIYIIIGISAIIEAIMHTKMCMMCSSGKMMQK